MAEAAVIDVGSNSVRLVAYRVDGRAMTPVLNEKVMAGLGRDLARTGALNPEGRRMALAALRRFATLAESFKVTAVIAVATAAVRDALDGPEFVQQVRRETGIRLRVIDGAEEARLSALGVLAGAPDATGVVGDLGGSSLELVAVSPDGPGRGETYPLGPLALARDEPFDPLAVSERVAGLLKPSRVLKDEVGGAFYAVGGAWRALGRIDISLRDHPIGVLHQHEMSRAEAIKVIDFVRKQSRRSLERLEEAAAKRADALPYAACVLGGVLDGGRFDRVVISSYGLREGLLLEALPASLRAMDPLVASAEAMAGAAPRTMAFGVALNRWLAPLFDARPPAFSAERDAVLRAAACRLADLGGALHPDQRAGVVYDLVLRAPFAGISHPERAFLALAVHHRYTKSAPDGDKTSVKLLSEDQRKAAYAFGAAMRLGCDLSGRSDAMLAKFALRLDRGVVVLSATSGCGHLLTDQATRRLGPLAQAMDLSSRIDFS